MCGTAGLFIGCSAVAFCPIEQLSRSTARSSTENGVSGETSGDSGDDQGESYRSPFRSWYDRSVVRSAPRRLLRPEHSVASFFPTELVPLAAHPLVCSLPESTYEQVLVQHLYRYLDFTAKLETLVVNRTALGIAHGSVRLELPDEMRLDALKIYCDEAYHALMSIELLRQVRDRTGIAPRLPDEPFFLHRLAKLQEGAGRDFAPLLELLFVIVSETLISGNLMEIPGAPDLNPVVRDVIKDHVADEGRHHAYFAILLRHLWAQLDSHTRRLAALHVPSLIRTFLAPDLPSIRAELLSYGMSREDVEQVVSEVFRAPSVREHTRLAASQTIRHFSQLGIMDDAEVHEMFEAEQLISHASA